MKNRKHLIIGAGSAGLSALEQIRQLSAADEIKIITMEDYLPYSPTVLPYLLSGKIDESGLPLRNESYFDRMRATLVRGKKVVSVLPDTREVVYDDGGGESYDTLLLATGSESARPAISGLNDSTFFGFHTLTNCRRLLDAIKDKKDVAVLGAGLVGMEVAIGLVERGCRVTIIERESRLLPLYFDGEVESRIREAFLSQRVRLLTGSEVTGISRKNGLIEIGFSQGEAIAADILVTCTGVKARTSFVSGAGITVDRGIVVDRSMKTSIDSIYAAGDVAQAADFFGGKPGVNPIILSAAEQGEIAGSNMAGMETESRGWISTNIFNFFGNTAFSAGMSMADANDLQILVEKAEPGGRLKKLVYDHDRLVGAMFLNTDLDPGIILYLIQNRVDIGPHKQRLFEQPREVGRRLMLEAEHTGTAAVRN